jgi:hypothetical protein
MIFGKKIKVRAEDWEQSRELQRFPAIPGRSVALTFLRIEMIPAAGRPVLALIFPILVPEHDLRSNQVAARSSGFSMARFVLEYWSSASADKPSFPLDPPSRIRSVTAMPASSATLQERALARRDG